MLIPMRGLVLIKKMESNESKEGILIVGDDVLSYEVGKVVSVGVEEWSYFGGQSKPFVVNEGDVVLYPKLSVVKVKEDGDEMVLVKESEILAIKSK